MREIEIEDVLDQPESVFIDVRSPGEYEESHIPGAINIPLFTNDERAQVGTTYKVEGKNQAKWLGMKVVSPKIPELMEQIKKEISEGKQPIIYCWRGGMRSRSVCTFAELSGLNVNRLNGGFRSYRQWVVEHLSADLLPQRFIVLHGMTGVGKTLILERLAKKGLPILDLEGIAGHRGSVFGGIGMKPTNQKTFESLLYTELKRVTGLPYVFIEAESRRIGKATQPDFMMEAKKTGLHIMLDTSVEIRTERIYEEYVAPNLGKRSFKTKVIEAITPILKRLPNEVKGEIFDSIDQEDYKRFIQILLTDYYDSKYQHKQGEYIGTFKDINVDDLDRAVEEIIEYTNRQVHVQEEVKSPSYDGIQRVEEEIHEINGPS